MNWKMQGANLIYSISSQDFSLKDTLDCGQCFRWVQQENGNFSGVHLNKFLQVCQNDDTVIFYDTSSEDFLNIWCEYFDFNTDYQQIKASLAFDETIKKAMDYAGGIRILKQNAWESLCSFIISQNNHIPRIKGIISRFCEEFGDRIGTDENDIPVYSFPHPETIATKSVEDLSGLRAGFRAKYIIDAAKKITDGVVDVRALTTMDLPSAQKSLQQICGVGPKVAQCVLLFGFYKLDAFPIDVWIKRALDYFYKDGFPNNAQKYAGIAQQYIFHYIRTCPEAIPKEYRK